MAAFKLGFAFLVLICHVFTTTIEAQLHHTPTTTTTTTTTPLKMYMMSDDDDDDALPMSDLDEFEEGLGFDDDIGDEDGGMIGRRSLFWRRAHYYISYGALSANRVPCPPRSGRSYYTHNCYRARGPVHPYTRGCSRITHCRR
ncbi:hypothetical protein Syun_015304 [Stephania yunnanensis]|uniref:Protein RALF-like 34 n=1 Tax=Stephania yunnanensis TaxID=152371 RepID=A0AAP0JLA3_9MAGN